MFRLLPAESELFEYMPHKTCGHQNGLLPWPLGIFITKPQSHRHKRCSKSCQRKGADNQVFKMSVQPERKMAAKPVWQTVVDCAGLSTKDLEVSAEKGKIFIHFKHIESESLFIEVTRTVSVPRHVDLSTVTCRLTPNGFLLLEGKLKKRESEISKKSLKPKSGKERRGEEKRDCERCVSNEELQTNAENVDEVNTVCERENEVGTVTTSTAEIASSKTASDDDQNNEQPAASEENEKNSKTPSEDEKLTENTDRCLKQDDLSVLNGTQNEQSGPNEKENGTQEEPSHSNETKDEPSHSNETKDEPSHSNETQDEPSHSNETQDEPSIPNEEDTELNDEDTTQIEKLENVFVQQTDIETPSPGQFSETSCSSVFTEDEENEELSSEEKYLHDHDFVIVQDGLEDHLTDKTNVEDSDFQHDENSSSKLTENRKTEHGIFESGNDGIKLCLDLHKYKPNEINVKVQDNLVKVSAKREIRGDNYNGTESYDRQIYLPESADPTTLYSTLQIDGCLIIGASYKK